MLNTIRRSVANAISPDKSHTYPILEGKWQSDEDYQKKALASNHVLFEKESGRPAVNDQEAISFTKKYVDSLLNTKKAQELGTLMPKKTTR